LAAPVDEAPAPEAVPDAADPVALVAVPVADLSADLPVASLPVDAAL